MLRLGRRPGEAASLRLEYIDWRAGTPKPCRARPAVRHPSAARRCRRSAGRLSAGGCTRGGVRAEEPGVEPCQSCTTVRDPSGLRCMVGRRRPGLAEVIPPGLIRGVYQRVKPHLHSPAQARQLLAAAQQLPKGWLTEAMYVLIGLLYLAVRRSDSTSRTSTRAGSCWKCTASSTVNGWCRCIPAPRKRSANTAREGPTVRYSKGSFLPTVSSV